MLRLDAAQESRPLSADETQFRKQLKGLNLGLSSLERTIARQRSRILQLSEGDANTRFFHAQAALRRRKNHIASLEQDNRVAYGHEENLEMLFNYFDDVLGTEHDRQHAIILEQLGLLPQTFPHLDDPFTEEEIWATIREMPSDKAPGPDGFSMAFYKAAWPVIKRDVIRAFNTFFAADRRQFHCLNSALITLIPKTLEAKSPKDFRPISLIHSFPKLGSKILANRLAPHLNSLISRN